MSFELYNTKSRKKELFTPMHEGKVSMYHCGPTVYHYAHIGNMRAYVFADILRKTFEYEGYAVTQVINITDVGHLTSDQDSGEDKMEKGSKREGKSVWDIARFYENAFRADLAKLNIETKNTLFPKATEYIKEQVALIETLFAKGYAYKISDGIYFDTAKFKTYGDLAKLDLKGLEEGARVEKNKEKRNPTDFALWKFSPTFSLLDKILGRAHKRQMGWDSPWGTGFPGWHIECSAMGMKLLGEQFDIHTGGIDHIPVHHTNEIAQSEAATGKEFVHTWMHVNFIELKDKKMSKSGDDFLTLEALIKKGFHPLSYRYWLLTGHYRTKLQFDFDALKASTAALFKLYKSFIDFGDMVGDIDQAYKARFSHALQDDLNTPQAIALVWELIKDTSVKPQDKKATLLSFDEVLGLNITEEARKTIKEIPQEVRELAEKRETARKEKNWEASDELRKEIEKLGYEVLDTKEGFTLVGK